tara:strand:- start:151 stop:708 length:558 start_codon:yes stop_codon:yes gene_type:complete
MKTFLILVVLFFSSSVLAEDISDFQIEGMSIGDSLLDYLSEEEILKQINNPKTSYDDRDPPEKYSEIYKYDGLKTYSLVSVFVEDGDKKYLIQGMFGHLKNSSIEKCLEEKLKVIKEFDILFKEEAEVSNFEFSIPEGFIYESRYFLNTLDRVNIQCIKAPNYQEHNSLLISLTNHALSEWLVFE